MHSSVRHTVHINAHPYQSSDFPDRSVLFKVLRCLLCWILYASGLNITATSSSIKHNHMDCVTTMHPITSTAIFITFCLYHATSSMGIFALVISLVSGWLLMQIGPDFSAWLVFVPAKLSSSQLVNLCLVNNPSLGILWIYSTWYHFLLWVSWNIILFTQKRGSQDRPQTYSEYTETSPAYTKNQATYHWKTTKCTKKV